MHGHEKWSKNLTEKKKVHGKRPDGRDRHKLLNVMVRIFNWLR